ncbi:MAG TPA: cytochrome c/FTR1 family iron permease [Methylomirabilota bacterium]|nr:cytochrome c/FTR1 family iron permease [Methylomirabilota bacterium]
MRIRDSFRRIAPRAALVAVAWLLVASPATAQAPPGAEPDPAQLILHILDYVAVDYSGAVQDGKVLDEGEYREQVEFVGQARALLGRLEARPERAGLEAQADRLVALVKAKGSDADVARLAGGLRWALIGAYRVDVAPKRVPDLKRGAALFAARCALCHGATGHGDGPAAQSLDPRPSDFYDAERMSQRSLYSVFSTITLGVEGTAMAGFRDLTEDERWALAFHVTGLAAPEAERARGQALWTAGKGRDVFSDLASLATRSPRELTARHGADAAAFLAYLRSDPEALVPQGNAAIAISLRLLRQSLEAYRGGRAREAQDLAVSAYLDGFELAEPSLDAVDHPLRLAIEGEMLRFRGLVKEGAPLGAVETQAGKVEALLTRAQARLDTDRLTPAATFVSAFIILLREGLEALLVVAAVIALLVKAGRRDALPWVHGGWVVALLLGGVTWWVASRVLTISGSTRETTEGVTALVAAAVLLYVGFWMHGKSQSHRWQAFLEARLAGALSGRTMLALASVSFLAVYREVFETVLFYEALAAQAGPSGGPALLGGLAAAAVALVALGWVIVRGSLRLPIGLFFGVSAIVVGVLAVVFVGNGIAALQEAGAFPQHALELPAIPLLGIHPSVEGLTVQALLLVILVAGFAWSSRVARERPA